ncbi:hypothetical protein [Microbacterium paraoxydans]|uniref:hypothetical protein n=1 Tax=Microbacterium paraoxydans TaxID=199592 RepID=UPI001CFA5584|nr:hypothetical protein [Microbacterium paraoxydans]
MIVRALRAHARTFTGDVVLLWVAVAAFVLSISMATSIPAEIAEAPADARAALAAPFSAVLATYGAVLAAVYGSFRYTLDRRDGVVAQRLMLQSRWVTLITRALASALGGAVVAGVALLGGNIALAVAMGGVPVSWASVGSTLAVGAGAGLWGMAVGVIVQSHLVALFVASMSLGSAVLVAMLWNAAARGMPLIALLEAFGFDVAAVGMSPHDGPSSAVPVAAGWMLAALVAGGATLLRRDVK